MAGRLVGFLLILGELHFVALGGKGRGGVLGESDKVDPAGAGRAALLVVAAAARAIVAVRDENRYFPSALKTGSCELNHSSVTGDAFLSASEKSQILGICRSSGLA